MPELPYSLEDGSVCCGDGYEPKNGCDKVDM